MSYRTLGRTGLNVSPFTLGSMEFGSKTPEEEAQRIYAMARDAGINTVDTANVYAGGRSEEIVGRLIKNDRQRIVLATKFSIPTDASDPNSGGTSRRTVIKACEESLARLQTDWVDILYVHRPFPGTAIDETLRALDDLVRSGKVRYIGTSSFAGWQLVEALWAASDLSLNRPVVEQLPYHLLDRRAERDMIPAALSNGVGLTVWSPLAGGLLTGKYLSGGDGRLQRGNAWGDKHLTEEADVVVRQLSKVAEATDLPLTTLSLAWTISRPGITSVVLGPRNTAQFADQLKALDAVISTGALADLDSIVAPGSVTVPYYLDDDWADFSPQLHGW